MKNLFEASAVEEIERRLGGLQSGAQRLWGTMNPAQALAHCNIAMEVATGERVVKRLFLGRILGPLFRGKFLGEEPFMRNSPTNPAFVVSEARDFAAEKERLLKLTRQFADGGPEKCTANPHSFFGTLTPAEWARAMYKHLDHHLRQFGA